MELAEDGFIPTLMSHFIMMHDATRTLSKTILNIEKVKQLGFHFHILAQVAKMTISPTQFAGWSPTGEMVRCPGLELAQKGHGTSISL